MSKIDFNIYVASQQNAVASTLQSFVADATKEGFSLVKPKGSKTTVFESKAGNPQLLFLNKDGKRIYVRISKNLDAALRAGEKGIELPKSPVYHVDLDTGGKMLVVGMNAEAQDFEPATFSAEYAVEPA